MTRMTRRFMPLPHRPTSNFDHDPRCGLDTDHLGQCCEAVSEALVGQPNPKDVLGRMKAPLGLCSSAGLVYEALGMLDGKDKYGRANWRENNVIASIYVDACLRHLSAWFDAREECAPDSGMPHLGHAKACLGILIDALEGGNLVDDRPPQTSALPNALSRAASWLSARAKRAT
jgi:hypothetical protein